MVSEVVGNGGNDTVQRAIERLWHLVEIVLVVKFELAVLQIGANQFILPLIYQLHLV